MSLPAILIVEDEIFVALDIERVLADAGYTVAAIAADRTEALAAAAHAELAFVDLNLRDGPTGPQLARDLARHGLKIIYVTANPAQIAPPADTAIGYIRKPFRDETILNAAAAALAGVAPADPDLMLFPAANDGAMPLSVSSR
ncbi:MAG: response regulator [Alphaproteobacteria bacterium]|nr:MAG: response regulator [Alphaproteobacteria bacterium]